jgi:hypothetical protein
MHKYIVNVHINKIDDNGNLTSEDFEYEFEASPLSLLEARRNAIMKAKDLISFFKDEMSEKEFLSFDEAEIKQFKGFNAYSISIILSTEDEPNTVVYGNDESEKLDWLESEYNYFKSSFNLVKSVKVSNETNDFEIIEEDSNFMLN